MSRKEQTGYMAEWLNPERIANTTGLGLTTVYRLIANGAIPSVRLGKHIRVRPEALAEWIAKGETKRVPPEAQPAPATQEPSKETDSSRGLV